MTNHTNWWILTCPKRYRFDPLLMSLIMQPSYKFRATVAKMRSLHIQCAIKLCERIKIWQETTVSQSSLKSWRSRAPIAVNRGSSPNLPANTFFGGGRPNFLKGPNPPKNRLTPIKERLIFWQNENCPPHRCEFTIDLQQCWSINRKIGNRQCTYYLIVGALTVTDCCFFCSCHHLAAITKKNPISVTCPSSPLSALQSQ